MVQKLTGWGKKGKPFTRNEFLKSHIRDNLGRSRYSYKQYLKDVNPRNERLKKFLKKAMK